MRRTPRTGNGEFRARGHYIDTALMRRARVLRERARARAAGAFMRRACWHVGAGACAERNRTAGHGRRRRVKRRRVAVFPCGQGINVAGARFAPPHRLQGMRFAIADLGFCGAAVARPGFFTSGRGYSRVRRAQGSAMYIEKAWIARAEVLREPGLGFARFAQRSGRTRARAGTGGAFRRRPKRGSARVPRPGASSAPEAPCRVASAPGSQRGICGGFARRLGRAAVARASHPGAMPGASATVAPGRISSQRRLDDASKTCGASSTMVAPARFSRNEDSRGMAA